MIVNPGIRRFLGSAIQRLFNSASFYAPLTHSLVPERGTGSPAFTRASTATFTDWEGVLRTVPSGCARFEGGRMVYNLWTTSSATLANLANKSLTLAAGTYTFSMGAGTGTATFSGTGGATGTLAASASGRVEVTKTITVGTFVVTASVADLVDLQVEYVTGQADQTASEYVSVGVPTDRAGDELVTNGTFDTATTGWAARNTATLSVVSGRLRITNGSFGGAEQAVSTVPGTKYVLARNFTAGTTTACITQIGTTNGNNDIYAGGIVSDAYLAVEFTAVGATTYIQCFLGDGVASNYADFDNISVKPAIYHGAGVDGVEFFNTDRDGALLSPQPAYLAEGARTQILATADIRDMTTAAWTLGATMTRARTSVGADGAANSATRLTGGAVAATNTCYTTITAAASSRTYSALVKRVTGTGPVRIVQTGTETDISSQLATTGYALVQLPASVLNVAVGFKIDTNGDAIDVDFNQFEDGAFASSRIASAMTRAADVLTYPSAGNISGTVGWVYVESTVPVNNGAPQIQIDDGSSNNRILIDDGNGANGGTRFFIQSGGAVEANIGDFSSSANTSQKRCVTWATNYAQSSQGGLLSAVDASVTTPVSFTQIGVGGVNGSAVASCTIRNLRSGQRQLSASEMQAITAP